MRMTLFATGVSQNRQYRIDPTRIALRVTVVL
jgi:hypothetical protein